MQELEFLKLCEQTRNDAVEMFLSSEGGHLPSALSLVEILVTLFFSEMRLPVRGFSESERDRFILSKGHGCLSLYSVLGRLGYFSMDEWKTIGRPHGILGGHPTSGQIPGIEVSTGSLGLGPSVAVGLAISARLRNLKYRTFCLLGDGECNEGSVWEAAMSAAQKKLSELYFLIDCNGYQAYGKTEDVWGLGSLRTRWEAFGFDTYEVDLRKDPMCLVKHFAGKKFEGQEPKAILCRTDKGMGIPFLENNPSWHNKTKLTAEEKMQLQGALRR